MTPLRRLQLKADTELQEFGKKKYKSCEICGRPMDCLHHFFPKSISSALRYDLDNCIPICTPCHYQHHTKSDPRIHGTVREKRGADWYKDLLKKKEGYIKPSQTYYKNIINEL